MSSVVPNIVLPFWKLSFACQIEIFETIVCLILTVKFDPALLLDANSAPNATDIDTDIFNGRSVSFNDWLLSDTFTR